MAPEITTLEQYRAHYQRALDDPQAYWAAIAQSYHWYKPWSSVLSGDFHDLAIRWFDGATTNLCYNCVDRHLPALASKTAIIWESNDPNEPSRHISFEELHREVCRTANLLQELGVQRGDRVCFYMPMVPEAAFAMLACTRIGAIHSIVFGGFSAQALADRINDASCKLLITADSTMRGTKEIRLKDIADEALQQTSSIENVLVVRRTGNKINFTEGRDLWYHEHIERQATQHQPAHMQAEDDLFILYTSGSTGKPKGVVHTTGGYMVYAGYSFRNVFQAHDDDIYWCSADIGWITGHTYLIYGPLLNGVTTIMFEGVPTWPDAGRFWDVIDKHKVSLFYTAPTAIRALEAKGLEHVQNKDLSTLKVLGTVGEPINQEAWEWYHQQVGRERCPIVDTWWQTETGGIMISPLAGITELIPTMATLPLPGIQPVLMDANGKELPPADPGEAPAEGNLCIKHPWPSMARTCWGDHERYRATYFSAYPGYYFTGDGARRRSNGYFRITGRVDDVINCSGHRIGTAEVEDAINEHAHVVESAVVGYPHSVKGQGIYAYIILTADAAEPDNIKQEVHDLVKQHIGSFACPDVTQIVQGLPKTRSGKIMRRILRKIADGTADQLGDTSTLLDPSVVEAIKAGAQAAKG